MIFSRYVAKTQTETTSTLNITASFLTPKLSYFCSFHVDGREEWPSVGGLPSVWRENTGMVTYTVYILIFFSFFCLLRATRLTPAAAVKNQKKKILLCLWMWACVKDHVTPQQPCASLTPLFLFSITMELAAQLSAAKGEACNKNPCGSSTGPYCMQLRVCVCVFLNPGWCLTNLRVLISSRWRQFCKQTPHCGGGETIKTNRELRSVCINLPLLIWIYLSEQRFHLPLQASTL